MARAPEQRWRSWVTAADRAWWSRAARAGSFDDLWTPALFRLAHEQLGADRARGFDGLGTAAFSPATLERVCLQSRGHWQPAPLRWVALPGREVGIPEVDDQLVVAAWRLLAEPRLDRVLLPHVHGYRRGRSPAGAVANLARGLVPRGGAVVRADIRRMFESLDHGHLLAAVDRVWPGAGLGRSLVERALRAWSPGSGVPTGVALSPALSNAALGVIDGVIEGMLRSGQVASAYRYADDFAFLVPSEPARVVSALADACGRIGLILNAAKTRIVPLTQAEAWPLRLLGEEVVPRADGRGILVHRQTPWDRRFAGFFR